MRKLCWQAISSELGQEKQKQSLGARVLLASDLIRAGPRSRSRVSLRAFCWQVISSTELGKKQKQSLSPRVVLARDLIRAGPREAAAES